LELQRKLDALTDALISGGKIPAPIVSQLMEGIQDQLASGRAERALKAGDSAPPFSLTDHTGALVSSASLLSRGPVVLSFYRGVWCPYCNLELKDLEEARVDIEARGAALVAVSMQNAANSIKAAYENNLKFPILIDKDGFVAAQFGLLYKLSPQLIAVYKTLGNDLEAINGESSWSLPMPARYVIDQDGVIAYAEVNPDYTHRPETSDLMPILDQMIRSRRTLTRFQPQPNPEGK
jgi:peroxiredoxin